VVQLVLQVNPPEKKRKKKTMLLSSLRYRFSSKLCKIEHKKQKFIVIQSCKASYNVPYALFGDSSAIPSTTKATETTLKMQVISQGSDRAYKVSIPLPFAEKCQFSLKGSQKVKEFLGDLKLEDSNITIAFLRSSDGSRIAQSSTIDDALESGAHLVINGKQYDISLSADHPIPLQRLSSSLYTKISSQEFENIKNQIVPLMQEKKQLEKKKQRNIATWLSMEA